MLHQCVLLVQQSTPISPSLTNGDHLAFTVRRYAACVLKHIDAGPLFQLLVMMTSR